MKVSEVFNLVRQTLRDQSTTPRWTNTALYQYLQQAENRVIEILPSAGVRYDVVALSAGDTRHNVLKADVMELLGVERNMGSDGATIGPPITLVDKSTLDRLNRSWGMRSGEVIDNYAIDEADNRRFYTFPRAHVQVPVYVELRVSQVAPLLSALDDSILIPQRYQHVLAMLVAGWALMEDEAAADFPRGKGLVDQAFQELGINVQVRRVVRAEKEGEVGGE